MDRLLDPKNDWAFRQVFGQGKNKNILIKFLNDVLISEEVLRGDLIIDVEFLKPEPDKEIADLRPSIVDVLCKVRDGTPFVVGMQRAYDSTLIAQALRYASRVSFKMEDEDNEEHQKLRPAVYLTIMGFNLLPHKENFISHTCYLYYDPGDKTYALREMMFLFLDLSKFHKNFEELETDVDRWAYFFKHADHMEPKNLKKVFEEDNVWSEAYRILERSTYSPEQLLKYKRYEMNEDEVRTLISAACRESKSDGEVEGKKKRTIEVAKKMLSERLDVYLIAKCTGLSVGEVQRLE